MLAALVLFSTWIVLGVPVALIVIPWTILTRDTSRMYSWAMAVVRSGLRLSGIRVEAEWRAQVDPAQTYIFLSNHVSNLDPPVLFPLLPGHPVAFLKRSLMKIPVLGYGMKLAGFIPVDRDGRVESAVESVDAAARVLASGVHVLSFVEGTRSRTGRLQPFKKGPFFLAMSSGIPVIPVSIHGTEAMMRKGSLKIYPGTAHVVFHPTLQPRDFASREHLMAAVRDSISSGLPDWMRPSE